MVKRMMKLKQLRRKECSHRSESLGRLISSSRRPMRIKRIGIVSKTFNSKSRKHYRRSILRYLKSDKGQIEHVNLNHNRLQLLKRPIGKQIWLLKVRKNLNRIWMDSSSSNRWLFVQIHNRHRRKCNIINSKTSRSWFLAIRQFI